MSLLEEIQPQSKPLVMELVETAGVDVSGWANIAEGRSAASNPKYCYEWSFLERDIVLVVNMWMDDVKEERGKVTCRINARTLAATARGVRKRRAIALDSNLSRAAATNIPTRAIICDGTRRDPSDPNSAASRVRFRSLDIATWSLRYDNGSGDAVFTRGVEHHEFSDQFAPVITVPLVKKIKNEEAYTRSPIIRKRVLARAKGCCELCSEPGFEMHDGRIYLETHHVVPLSEGGKDSTRNVVALCPNHHRAAHYSRDKKTLTKKLKKLIS